MRTSLTATALSLPVLSAVLLTLSSASAQAQAHDPLTAKGRPGEVREIIAPEATVVSTAHYQAQLGLVCPGGSETCAGDFPNVAAKHRLNVTRVTCWLQAATQTADYRWGNIQLLAADNSSLVHQVLPPDYKFASDYYYPLFLVNRAVDLQARAKQHFRVSLQLGGQTATVDQAVCTVTGTLETLQ